MEEAEDEPLFAERVAGIELKDLRDELRGLHGLWAVWVLGFAGAGGVVLFRGGLLELACDGGVLDGGGVVDAEHGGEVQGVGAAGEGFFRTISLGT